MAMTPATCFACEHAPRAVGLLCEACARGLTGEGLCPEQVRAQQREPLPGRPNAWLIDGFGVPHTISVDPGRSTAAFAAVGRSPENDLAIADATVSLRHAHLEHRARSGAWFVVDQGSGNGTFVGDDRVARRFPLEPGDRLCFGRRQGFVFLPLDEELLPRARLALRWWRAQTHRVATRADAAADVAPELLRVSAVTEGGAVCTWGEHRVQLSELEYELLVLLWQQWERDREVDAAARGFVPGGSLLERLTFHSEAPTHNNLRVLVRKVRRKFAEPEPPVDVIESQKGLGYRLARPLELS